MERLDPWHRVFEMNIKRNYSGDVRTENPTGHMDGALALWLGSSQHDNTPFFIWLEGNYVCTGVDDDGTLNREYRGIPEDRKPHRGVTYLKRDDAMLLLVQIKGGLAYPAVQRFDPNQSEPVLMGEYPGSEGSEEPGHSPLCGPRTACSCATIRAKGCSTTTAGSRPWACEARTAALHCPFPGNGE